MAATAPMSGVNTDGGTGEGVSEGIEFPDYSDQEG